MEMRHFELLLSVEGTVSFLFVMLFSLLTDILYCIMMSIQKLFFFLLSLIRKCVQAYHKNVEVTKIHM